MPHIHTAPGQVDHTVEVFIVYKNKVLLRKHDKYKIWLSIGGHIELNEDPNQAAIRETREETGLDIKLVAKDKDIFVDFEQGDYKELVPPIFLNRHRITPTHEHITYSFYALSTSDKVVPENAEDEWRWFTEEELNKSQDEIRPSIKHYALTALRTLV